MADDIDVTPSTSPNKVPVATDEVAGRHYQAVKLVDGRADKTTPISRLLGLDVRPSAAGSDALGRFRVAAPRALFESLLLYDKGPLFWSESVTNPSGLATSVFAVPSVVLTVGGSGDAIVRQTFQRFAGGPGRTLVGLFAGALPTLASSSKRMGLFDANNGAYLENDGTGYFLGTRKGGIDTKVAQASWNVDPLDGTGPSGVTLDLSKAQVLAVDLSWFGAGAVRFGFLVGGAFLLAHESYSANASALALVNTPSLPARYEHSSTGGQGAMTQFGCAVLSEGAERFPSVEREQATGTSPIPLAVAGTQYAMVGLKLHATNLDAIVDGIEAAIVATSQEQIFCWRLHLNPTVTGTFSYAQVSGSLVDAAIATDGAATITGDGTVLDSGFSTGSFRGPLRSAIRIGASVAGVADALVLSIAPIFSASGMLASLRWREFGGS